MSDTENPVEDVASHFDQFQTRASLLLRLHQEDKGSRDLAWEEFESRYAPIIRQFASRCGAQPHDIDDILQDIMTSLAGRGKRVSIRSKAKVLFEGTSKPAQCGQR